MGLFDTNNRRGNPATMYKHVDGVPGIRPGDSVEVEISEEKLIVGPFKKPIAVLPLSRITAVEQLNDTEVIDRSKSVIGRGVAGALILGPLGAIVGGMSGVGTKKKKVFHNFIVINYVPGSGGESKAISFETLWYVDVPDEFAKALRKAAHVEPVRTDDGAVLL